MNLKSAIENVLSDILSDQHEATVTLKFEKEKQHER